MLRPATPLAICLFVAFALQLLSTLSTPIIRAIPLASFEGIEYGVFGFCQGNTCSPIRIGYTARDKAEDFSLPENTRHSLTSILIVHPVACLLTLICFILAVLSHLHSPAHSSRYLLGLIIFMLPTLLVSLLAFLVDILLFVPHLGWGGWIVLASTILIVLSGVLTCAMRRTIVSRKARKKRIAENAEMSGENFFNRQNSAPTAPPLSQQPTAPIVNGSSNSNALPSFATYDQKQRISDDDRTPLNSRSATGISSNGIRPSTADDGMDRYAAGRGGSFSSQGSRGRGGRMYNGPRDEYGNPMPPSGAYGGGMRGPDGQYPRKQYSNETMSSQNSRGRGRGGYPPRGYGRGGPYGGGRGGRGGMAMGAMAAGGGMMAGEMMGRGQRGPPPGYNNGYPPQGRAGPGQYGQSAYGQRISPGPPGYGRNPSPGPPSRPGLEQPENGLARAESPPPLPGQNPSYPAEIGQAIEMDASTGSPANTPGFPPPNNALRESDSDVQGLVGLQQSRAAGQEPLHSPSSNYSQADAYVPARAAWAGGVGRNGTPPLGTIQGANDISARRSPPNLQQAPNLTPSRARVNSGDNYYEDVDPRFTTDPSPDNNTIPTLLVPGNRGDNSTQDPYGPASSQHLRAPLQPSASYDSVNDGPESDASNFTSISQRGVNPEWQADQYGMGGVPNRVPPQQRDFLLSNNPDFEISGGRGRGGGQGGGPRPGMI